MSWTNRSSPYNTPLQYSPASKISYAMPVSTNVGSPSKIGHRKTQSYVLKLSESPRKGTSNIFKSSAQNDISYLRHRPTLSFAIETADSSIEKPSQYDLIGNIFDSKRPFSERPQPKTARDSAKIQEKEQTGYDRLRQQLNRKEMLINELKKLSEVKEESRNYRESSPSYYQKANQQLFSPQKTRFSSKDQEIGGQQNNDSYKLSLSRVATKYTRQDRSTREYLQSGNSLGFNEKSADKMIKDKEGRQDWVGSKKNPEEGRDQFKKAKYKDYRPRDVKYQNELGSQLQLIQLKMTKISSDITYPTSNNYISDLFLSTSCNQVPSNEPQSPITLRGKRINQIQGLPIGKGIRDIKKSLIKSSVLMSSNRRPSIFDFEIGKNLGEGKFGMVFQVFHKATNSIYAIKKIKKDVIRKNKMIDQFLEEIKIQSYCCQGNILKLYGFFDDNQYIYQVLEYMEEGTLYQLLKKNKTLLQNEASKYLRDVASAIAFLHDLGIVHRDIKPENIVVSHGVAKLCDFGWAAICTDRRKTNCGTFDYAAPEIIEGKQYDTSVDLWCLGVMAYELLVGKAPFYNVSRKQTIKKILNVQKQALNFPSHLSEKATSFVQGLLRRNPEQRMEGDEILADPFLNLPEEDA